MTDANRDNIMRLLVEVGQGCQTVLATDMHDLLYRRVQVDKIWAFVGKKQ